MPIRGSCSAPVAAAPDAVFAVVTDVSALPSWNERLTEVVEDPGELGEASEWVVALSLGGVHFQSRSTVLELDRAARRFSYRSVPVGRLYNGSFAVWTWEVEPEGEGSLVTLAWELHARRQNRLIAPFRSRQMRRKDGPRSLAALAWCCAPG